MVCNAQRDESKLTITLKGILDTSSVPDLEKKIDLTDIKELDFILDELQSISSSGIRILLYCQQVMNGQGNMKIFHPTELVYEVFELTGLDEIFNIEKQDR